ncbi:MAG: riboflavin biosynthesis protein RibF, partial [Bacteroidales bacterium]|nr:riboflavin biosynthesis protein RibF [Bacteroidales bacterium]
MVVTTGFFDGVHLGHRFVIERLVDEAARRGCRSLVVTFWPHPRTVLQDNARGLHLLSSLEEKKQALLALGVDQVEVLDFTREFSRLTAEEYLRTYVKERFGGKAVLIGYDQRLGCDRPSAERLREATL